MCHAQERYLFTHAGVTNDWLERANHDAGISVVDFINSRLKDNPKSLEFIFTREDYSGNNTIHSPIWVRPQSLLSDTLLGWTHVVGHTNVQSISPFDNTKGDVIFTDVLSVKDQFLVIEDGIPKVVLL